MDVLLCLADAAGAVIERESLLTAVWGEGAVGRKNTIRAMASPIIRCYPPYPSEGTAGILPGSVLTRYDLLCTCVRGRLQYA